MKNDKEEAIKLIKKKLNKESYLTYNEIAEICGYHPKYIFKLKKQIEIILLVWFMEIKIENP